MENIIEKAMDKCTDPERGALHIGKYDHEYLEKVIREAVTAARKQEQINCTRQLKEFLNPKGMTTENIKVAKMVWEKYLMTNQPPEAKDLEIPEDEILHRVLWSGTFSRWLEEALKDNK